MFSLRIGHFARNTEIYLCEKDLRIGTPHQRFLDIWYYKGFVSNTQLQKMWNLVLRIWPMHLSFLIERINSKLPDNEPFKIPRHFIQDRDINNVMERIPPHLTFSSEEEELGRKTLTTMGIPKNASFICFVGRDSRYLQLIYPTESPNNDHDYRDTDIKKYIPAAEEMTRRGYYMIRMGSAVLEPLKCNNPRIIDYAANGQRSEFGDIYLGAKCHFFISVGTGIDAISGIFRVPILYVNFIPLEHLSSWAKHDLFIPKLLWLEREHRLMTFREIFESGAGRYQRTNQYIENGIIILENSEEEICEATIEMEERLKGTWVTMEEDAELQKRFWDLFPRSELHGKINIRIGTDFIRKYKALLE